LLVFILYLRTLAPGVEFQDSGELITDAARLWVPHPSGYPIFLLVGFLFSKLPFGAEPAFRLNLMSAFFFALAVGVFALWIKKMLDTAVARREPVALEAAPHKNRKKKARHQKPEGQKTGGRAPLAVNLTEPSRWVLACFGALLLAVSRPYWSLTTAAEVYAIYALVLAVNLLLFTTYITEKDPGRERRIEWLWGLTVGLSFACHLSTILLGPVFLAVFIYRLRTWKAMEKRLLRLAVPFALGLSVYLLLPILASREPPYNMLYPLNPSKFVEHITGARYRLWFNSPEAMKRNLPIALETPGKFGYVGFVLSVIGLFASFRIAPRLARVLLLGFVTCFFYALYYKSQEIEPFFMHSYIVIAIWGVFGLILLSRLFKRWPKPVLFGIVMPAALAASVLVNFREVDRSGSHLPEELVRNMVGDALPNAVIFSNDFFRFQAPFMYLRYMRNLRPDVADIFVAPLTDLYLLRFLERYHPDLYSKQMRDLLERLPKNPMTKDQYHKKQIGYIVDRVYGKRPVYFENTVPHSYVPDGYKLRPQGLLYRIFRNGEDPPPPDKPKTYPFHDVAYVDYNVDKARDNYLTMMYANGIWAEMSKSPERAIEYYKYAVSFFPTRPERVSNDDEGRALWSQKAEVEGALAKVEKKLASPNPTE
jgi:hypothetical protein